MKIATDLERRSKLHREAERTKIYGPPPVNVFTELRKNLGLSHESLARRICVSKQSLIRLEQGTFTEPLPAVIDYYVKSHNRSELAMRDSYEEFQHLQRVRHSFYFGDSLTIDFSVRDHETGKVLHPFRQLRHRIGVNPTEVAKDLCISQPTILHFERHYRKQQSAPKQLQSVLLEIGYSSEQVNSFCSDYAEFRNLMRG